MSASAVQLHERSLDDGISAICSAVLEQSDPLWDDLQSRLPSKYLLMRRLGGGSTSDVYLANDLSIQRQVAVRTVRHPVDNPEFDEAVQRAVHLGRHAAILTVFEAWLEQDPHCCVVEHVKGRSLRSHLDRRTDSWGVRDVVRLLLRIGEALIEMHSRNIHLRDLRPSKILIDESGNATICGLSKPDNAVGQALLLRVRSGERRLTQEQARYLVPEHFYPLGGPESQGQSDQYLLGLVAYEILTSALPSTLANPDAVVEGQTPQFVPLEPLRELRGTVTGCPRALSDAIARMTSINPRERFARLPDALDVIRDLQQLDLVLARESYVRCTRSAESEKQLFDSFYVAFRAASPEAGTRFGGLTASRWRRLHGLLKEAVLLLFAYCATPPSGRSEPNVLSRIAAMHGDDGKLDLRAAWFDDFARAMVQTICKLDPECGDARLRPLIEQAWQSSLEPGIGYMKSYCQTSEARSASRGATSAGRARVTKRKTARRDGEAATGD